MELNKADWYETQFVVATDFDPDQYGNQWYSVKFMGDADSHMWLAKEKPEENKKYYGHFEPTKSGKKLRFKRESPPEDTKPSAGKPAWKDNSKEITLGMVWKTVAGIRGLPENDTEFEAFFEIVRSHTDELLRISENLEKSDG